MRFIYIFLGLVFISLGGLYFLFKQEILIQQSCAICCGLSKKDQALVDLRRPLVPLVDGHYMLFTHRHLRAFEEFTQVEKEAFLSVIGSIEKKYLKEYGVIGHNQALSSFISGHLVIDVIPKKGWGNYLYFQVGRFIRNLNLKESQLFLDNQNLVLEGTETIE